MVGPLDKSVELWRTAVEKDASAENYYGLSDALAHIDQLPQALESLKMAVVIAPHQYSKYLDEMKIVETTPTPRGLHAKLKKGRYPDTLLIQSDLKKTILDFVAADLKSSPKFIFKETKFFTMGSCFAHNIARALKKANYITDYMGISEHINSTYANRYFVDWLEESLPPNSMLLKRINEIIPTNYTKETLIDKFKECEVFILTLGVAPSFFDRETGEFVMPRSTALNSRALAEKYEFRTTSVEENVQNVLYLLTYIRKLNPHVKIVLTESPVPLQMTFEFKSAIVADCLSKSTLRVAAHEIVNNAGLGDIYYWPSFEIFRWLGCHLANPVYGTDDGAAWHVSEDLVDLAMECFVEMFRSEDA